MKCGGWKPAWLNEQVFNLVDIIHCPRGGNWVSIFPHKNRKSPRNGYRHISLSSSFLTLPGRASVSLLLPKKEDELLSFSLSCDENLFVLLWTLFRTWMVMDFYTHSSVSLFLLPSLYPDKTFKISKFCCYYLGF